MDRAFTLGIVSDIHYASDLEKARGDDYELRAVASPALRLLLSCFRHFIWLRHPLRHNQLLDDFLHRVSDADCVIANGDYCCDSAFVGVSDDAAFQSARECLGKLRSRFGGSFHATLGDHDLGKPSLIGANGGMRFASCHRAFQELGIEPFWQQDVGHYTLMGIASSLVALPALQSDILDGERVEWENLRRAHVEEIRAAFSKLARHQRVVLFCHDPTALPFLWREDRVRERLDQVELTVIGHLHSNLILWKSRLLAGMPGIPFLGHSIKKMSGALHEARYWKPFHVQLCPSLAGLELLKDGGFLTVELDREARHPARVVRHRIPR
jgi:hypothetical protein